MRVSYLPTLLLLCIMLQCKLCQANDCFSAIFSNPDAILPMVTATGKNINDLGDFDACTLHPGTDYALLYLNGAPIFIGL